LPEETKPADVQTALMEEIRKGNRKQSLLDTYANDFEILGSQ